MKFKYNWGWGIAFSFSIFVASLLAIVIYSRTINNDLVEEDYYVKEMDYQTRIDKINRTANLDKPLVVDKQRGAVIIDYPFRDGLGGFIHIYRPSDKNLDKKYYVAADTSGKQIIDVSSLKKGLWKLKIEWSCKDSCYYNEEDLILD